VFRLGTFTTALYEPSVRPEEVPTVKLTVVVPDKPGLVADVKAPTWANIGAEIDIFEALLVIVSTASSELAANPLLSFQAIVNTATSP